MAKGRQKKMSPAERRRKKKLVDAYIMKCDAAQRGGFRRGALLVLSNPCAEIYLDTGERVDGLPLEERLRIIYNAYKQNNTGELAVWLTHPNKHYRNFISYLKENQTSK